MVYPIGHKIKKIEGFKISDLKKGEKIIKVVRRHWFNILQQYFMLIFIFLLMIASLGVFPSVFYKFLSRDAFLAFFFIESTLAVILWIYGFVLFIEYYFDVWIITNKRVINIEQKSLFIRHRSELQYRKIQDVTVEVEGIIPSILHYGEVHIQTAGGVVRFIFRQVPHPHQLKDIIMHFHHLAHKKELNYLRHTNNLNE